VKNNTIVCVARASNNKRDCEHDLYCCLLPRCEALRTYRSGFPIATLPNSTLMFWFLSFLRSTSPHTVKVIFLRGEVESQQFQQTVDSIAVCTYNPLVDDGDFPNVAAANQERSMLRLFCDRSCLDAQADATRCWKFLRLANQHAVPKVNKTNKKLHT